MPKKRNFLGGMQNYNAQTGEYEPALKGPNGESPSGFKSFKKQEDKDESFDTVNKKRMGIDKKISKWEEENPEGKVLKGKSVKEIKENAENGTFKLDKEKYPDVEETPYGFIYNVNGESITDLKAQNEKSGMGGGSGFSLTKDGDEVYFETFEDAYKAAKGENGDKDFNAEIKKTADDIRSSGDRYTYMMLDRLRSDAEYVLGEGKGAINQLWYNGDPKKHIALMKDLHNGLKDKPEWLSMEKINEYEKKFNDLGPVYVKDNDRKKLTKAGFTLDDTYSGGDTYEIYDKDTGRYNSISLSDDGKYYYTTINGTVYYYEDLDTAIDRATYKSGKAPSNGAIGWEDGAYDNARAEKKLKELRGY